MPIREYQCKSCGCEFEEIVNGKEDSATMACKNCGAQADRKMSRFASVIAGGSGTEPVDMTIGREAEKRWQMHYDKQSGRRSEKDLKAIELPKAKDGKFMPVMGLGNKQEKEKRSEYSTTLQEHRKEREKKGIPQFTESGAF
jgi:putative FmdB family regulatory protein